MAKLIDIVKLDRLKTKLINDTTPSSNTIYSSSEIDTKIGTKQEALTPGTNITIEKNATTGVTTISTTTPTTQIKLGDVSGASGSSNKRIVSITWSDPDNVVVGGVTLAEWAGTKVIRKVGSAPSSISDGTLIVDNTVKNQYSSSALTDNTVEYGSVYYYRFFPYTAKGLVTEGSTVSVEPEKIALSTVPSQSGTLTYNGSEQSPSWNNFNSEQLSVTGNSGTNADDYVAVFTPKDDYRWSDDSEYKSANWSIGKANGSVTLSSSSVTLDSEHLSVSVNVTGATGDVSVSSGDSSVATASYSNGVITITSVNETSGSTSITVNIASSGNYESTSESIGVTASFLVSKSWDTATDAEIVAMVAAADAGNLDLSQYWSVGQSRNVKIRAISANSSGAFTTAMAEQTVEMVLMNEGYMSQSGIHFVVGTKDCLNQKARMNSSNTNNGSWEGCKMKIDLNDRFYNAIKSYDGTTTDANFRGIFKTFDVLTAQTYNGSTNQTTSQKFALFAEKEVFGSRTNSNTTEANALSQIKYYETSSNRVKQVNGNNTVWCERSPHSGSDTMFCGVGGKGDVSASSVNSSSGVAPFGCI